MANVAHMDKQDKQKVAEIALDLALRKVMPIARARQRLKSVKTLRVPTIYHVRSGNAAVLSR
jgi:hypothetical protein